METYDLSHFSFQVGKIGLIKGIDYIPVLPDDKINYNLSGVWRLSPLRRNLAMDCKIDIVSFYMPYRHVYTNWQTFIQDGVDETQNLATLTAPEEINMHAFYIRKSTAYPLMVNAMYNRIWNRYFRIPSSGVSELADNDQPSNAVVRDYGREAAFLKKYWNTGIVEEVDNNDQLVGLASSNTKLSLLDLAQQKARLKTERKRDWFARRYQDVMNETWGVSISEEVDQRPTMIMRSTEWLSGYDVDGTDDASLGQYSGKAAAIAGTSWRFSPAEHGAIMVMAVLRFPPVAFRQSHFLIRTPNPSYKQLAGDPEVVANEPPTSVKFDELFMDSGQRTLGVHPYAQWYRCSPDWVHNQFENVQGFPFLKLAQETGTQLRLMQYHHYSGENTDYSGTFQTTQLRDWQAQLSIECSAERHLPGPLTSVFAGSN